MRIYCIEAYPDGAMLGNFVGRYRVMPSCVDRTFRRKTEDSYPAFFVAGSQVSQIVCEEAIERYLVDRQIAKQQNPPDYVALNVLPDGSYVVESEVRWKEGSAMKPQFSLLYGDRDLEWHIQEFAKNLIELDKDLEFSDSELLARSIFANESLWLGLSESSAFASLISSIDLVKKHGATTALPVLEELWEQVAEKDKGEDDRASG